MGQFYRPRLQRGGARKAFVTPYWLICELNMLTWSISARTFPLRYTWKISRNASDSKTNLFVEVSDGSNKGMGEAAPNIRYEEVPDQLLADFKHIKSELPTKEIRLDELTWILDHLELKN